MHKTTSCAAMRVSELLNVRRQNFAPLNLFITKETVSRHGVGPIPAGLGDAGSGLGAQALDQADRTPIASGSPRSRFSNSVAAQPIFSKAVKSIAYIMDDWR